MAAAPVAAAPGSSTPRRLSTRAKMPKKGGGGGGGGGGGSIRLTLMVNGDPHKSHIMMGTATLDNVIAEACKGLKEINAKAKKHRVFDTTGRVVSDADLTKAKTGDIVFVSNGEDFIPPAANRAMGKKKMKKAGGACYSTNAAFMNAERNSLALRGAGDSGGGGAGGGGGSGGGGGNGGGSTAGGKSGGKNSAPYQRIGNSSEKVDEGKVLRIIAQRTEAKRSGEFAVADSCRDQLRKLGVVIDDNARTWKISERHQSATDLGERGHDYRRLDDGAAPVSVGKVHKLLAERIGAKRAKDYTLADSIRDELQRMGVVVDDKERTWQVLGSAGPLVGGRTAGGGGAGPGVTTEPMEEWQRLPKELLQNYCQKEKLQKPTYQVINGSGQGRDYLCRAILDDGKKRKMIYPSNIAASQKINAEHFAALCALFNVTPNSPREKMLPEPYRSAWLKFATNPPPGQLEKVKQVDPNARDRSVNKKSEYQEVNMSEANRMFVESVIRRCQSDRDDTQQQFGDSAASSDKARRGGSSEELDVLLGMKWPKQYIDKAIAASGRNSGVSELLDWLCLNTPESELPAGFAAQMRPKIEVFSFKKEAEKIAAKARESRLFKMNQGEAEPEPEVATDRSESAACDLEVELAKWIRVPAGDAALVALSEGAIGRECAMARRLTRACTPATDTVVEELDIDEEDGWDLSTEEDLAEEFEVLQSIYGEEDCIMCRDGKTAGIFVRLRTPTLGSVVLQCWVSEDVAYPKVAPVCVLRGTGLTGTICVSVMRKLQEKAAALAGEPMMYSLVEELRDDDSWLLVQDVLASTESTAGIGEVDDASESDTTAVSDAVSEPDDLDSNTTSEFVDAFEITDDRQASGRKRTQHTRAGLQMPRFSEPELATLDAGVTSAMKTTRQNLPSAKKRSDIISALKTDQVLVVTGETGCGKTTQVPQFIMEELGGECFIVCTQPRRISAIGVATRVAQERGESIDGTTSSIGYAVRGASRRTSKTRLLFCTTGVLLRRMQQQDMLLDGSSTTGRPAVKVTHIIVDEVHERSLDSDHLLTLLRDMLPYRPDIKVILMSATINAERFAGYFGGCGIQHIPGFTHPVEQYFLEDVIEFTGHRVRGKHHTSGDSKDSGKLTEDQLGGVHSIGSLRQSGKYSEATVESLKCVMGNEEQVNSVLACKLIIQLGQRILDTAKKTIGRGGGSAVTGAILVFLPGLRDIRAICDILSTGRGRFRGSDLDPAEAAIASEILYPLMLHSTVPPRDQARVFQRPPRGLVKVVLSTNIAETSITIDDVVCVVDTLRVNETGFDPVNGIACLKEQWCSQAAHRQRAGRAGRVRAGECWCLATKKRHDACARFEQPEIFRVPLDQLYLKIESSLASDAGAAAMSSNSPAGLGKPKLAKNAHEVLQRFMDPPDSAAVMGALDSLKDIGALDNKRKLTPLGHHLAYIPIDLRLAKILLYGAIFRCVDPAASIAACIGAGRSPLLNPPDKREEAKEAHKQFVVRYSDHLTLLRVYEAWNAVPNRERRRWCASNFLSDTSLQEIAALRKQLLAALVEMGFLPIATKEKWNQHSTYPKVICLASTCLAGCCASGKACTRDATVGQRAIRSLLTLYVGSGMLARMRATAYRSGCLCGSLSKDCAGPEA